MDRMDYFLQLYGTLPRAGPGSTEATRRAFASIRDLPPQPRILDIGCGPGVQTVDLLRLTSGTVVALDLLPSMVARTRLAARAAGLADRLAMVRADMLRMPLRPGSFDLVWSEGAIYFLGFENGLRTVRELIRPGAWVAISEAVWLRPDPPAEAVELWSEYPEIDTVEHKLEAIARVGYEPVAHFVLPPEAWTVDYYDHLARRIEESELRWKGNPVAENVLAEARNEIAVFDRCRSYYSYAFFVMRA